MQFVDTFGGSNRASVPTALIAGYWSYIGRVLLEAALQLDGYGEVAWLSLR